jgi:hypothetical protein
MKDSCPLQFSYTRFGDWYVVSSGVWEDIFDILFLGSAGSERLQKKCAWQDACDHTICLYQKELLGLLSVKDTTFFSKKV